MSQLTIHVRRGTILVLLLITTCALAGASVGLVVSGTYPRTVTKIVTKTVIQSVPVPGPTVTVPATASDVQVCNDVNTWESNNDGLAATNFGTDSSSQTIVSEAAAAGSSAVDNDVQNLSRDSGSSASADISSLKADCAAAGVTLTGSDFLYA